MARVPAGVGGVRRHWQSEPERNCTGDDELEKVLHGFDSFLFRQLRMRHNHVTLAPIKSIDYVQ